MTQCLQFLKIYYFHADMVRNKIYLLFYTTAKILIRITFKIKYCIFLIFINVKSENYYSLICMSNVYFARVMQLKFLLIFMSLSSQLSFMVHLFNLINNIFRNTGEVKTLSKCISGIFLAHVGTTCSLRRRLLFLTSFLPKY